MVINKLQTVSHYISFTFMKTTRHIAAFSNVQFNGFEKKSHLITKRERLKKNTPIAAFSLCLILINHLASFNKNIEPVILTSWTCFIYPISKSKYKIVF